VGEASSLPLEWSFVRGSMFVTISYFHPSLVFVGAASSLHLGWYSVRGIIFVTSILV
jgi:hypothetical protein